jgi:hypothetical protein
MLDPTRLLISCPECNAWPMAANVRATWRASPSEVTFSCASCGLQEAAAVSASGQLLKTTRIASRRTPKRLRNSSRPMMRDRATQL